MLEAADEIGGGTRIQRGDRARAAARPLLGVPPDGRRARSSCRRWSSSGTGCTGASRRSTARIRSTTAAPACCTARSRPPPPDSARDGAPVAALFGRTSARFDALSEDIMGPLLRVPHHPLTLARFGAPTVLPAVSAGPGVSHRRGPRTVRRGRRARLPAVEPPADVGDRARHHHRRAPARLAGGRGRVAVDHRRAGRAARRPRRQDRDRDARRRRPRSCRSPT